MLCPTTLFFADKSFVKGAICKKQPCSTLVRPLTKKIIHCVIIMELPKFCNPEELWAQIWRCQCYLLLLYNSYRYAYSYLSQCKSTYKTQYPSTSLHRARYWAQSLTRANVELAAVLYTQKATFYHLGRDCQSKKNIMQAPQVTSLFREFHRSNPLESWFASSFLCDVDFLDQV